MKKLITATCIAFTVVLMVSSCKKVTSNPHSGTYTGKLSTTVGLVEKDNIPLVFTNGVSDETNLYLYGIKLSKINEDKYEAQGEQIVKLIQIVLPETKAEEITNTSFVFNFSDGTVDLDAKYNLAGFADLAYMKYHGTKK